MTVYKTILCACDLDDGNNILVDKAHKLAVQNNGSLHLLHVIQPFSTYGYPFVSDHSQEHIKFARDAINELAQSYDISAAQQHIKVGSVKHIILECTREVEADLLVIGCHSHQGVDRILGSTASAVNHSATCDVLTLHI